MGRFTVAAKGLRGPFAKLITKLRSVLKRPATIRRSAASQGPSRVVTRSLDDLSTLRGAEPDEIRRLVPSGWIEMPMKKGDGVRFLNPKRPGEMIAIESGVPGHADTVHSGPYLKISRNGATERIPLRGNPALGD